MIGSSRGLFRAVVVMGAALAGCDRSASPVEPAADERGGAAGEAAVRAPEPVEPAPAAVEATRPEVVTPEVVAPVEPGTVPVVVVEAEKEAKAKAEAEAKRRAKQERREKCPEGSERPYPPCFYIL